MYARGRLSLALRLLLLLEALDVRAQGTLQLGHLASGLSLPLQAHACIPPGRVINHRDMYSNACSSTRREGGGGGGSGGISLQNDDESE